MTQTGLRFKSTQVLAPSHQRITSPSDDEATFAKKVQFAAQVGAVPGVRPEGIKGPLRTLEKVYYTQCVPLDLLGGTLTVAGLDALYAAGVWVESAFTVVGFRDRFVQPQRSGYRDVQFIVALEGGLRAELKLVLRDLDTLDAYEHRVYEVLRTLEGPRQAPLNAVQTIVAEELRSASRAMYSRVWSACLDRERGDG